MIHREFRNTYADEARASSYADLGFPATYYLAFRDLPSLFERHVTGLVALDFGCGAGRSTRFLMDEGFDVLGVDISEPMLTRARERDPEGDYVLIPEGDLAALRGRSFDLVLCAFTFDNVPTATKRTLFEGLRRLLAEDGRVVNLVSAPEIYVNEWTSFSTKDFMENAAARSGDVVRIRMLDVPDGRPVEDVFWTEDDYREAYAAAGLEVLEIHRPLGKPTDPFTWISETRVSPWTIYVLAPSETAGPR